MFTNILVAVDGSDASQRAFIRAVEEAKMWKARLHVIYIVETGLFSSLPADNTVEIMYRVLETEGNAVLEKAKKYAADNGVTAVTHMKQGHAGSEVVTLAEKEKADLVMVGSHGKSQADRLLIGSVSTYVVTHSKVTTMVVRS
ncbi:MAG: universal stress protein [Methanoregula sp.]|nr:universal stress protein [Methanoregula sp.]